MSKNSQRVAIAVVTEPGITLDHVALIVEAIEKIQAKFPEGTQFTAAIRDTDAIALEAVAQTNLSLKHIQATDWETHKVMSKRLEKEVNLGAIFASAELAAGCKALVLAQPKPQPGDRLYV